MRQVAALVSAAAVGALLFSVHVATEVFRDMPNDRVFAGRIAGRAFTGAYAIAAVSAVLSMCVVLAIRTRRPILDRTIAFASLLIAALQLGWIAPAIVAHGAGWPWSFASLHATGGLLHVTLAALALVLAWRLLDEDVDRVASRA